MGVDLPWIIGEHQSESVSAVKASKYPAVSSAVQPVKPAVASVEKLSDTSLARPDGAHPTDRPPVRDILDVIVKPPAPEVSHTTLDNLSLVQIAAEVSQCQRCELCQTRGHAVVGQGVEQPTLLIVGEAPGEQEDIQGQPFVGRSGQLLDNMLRTIGHDRHTTTYITNVVKCRPPANRNPRDEEIAACAPYLSRQIELLKPKCVLAMGRFAAHALLKTDQSLQKLRQQVHSVMSGGEPIPVVVTYHPAYLLRRPVDKALAWEDLKRLRQHLLDLG